MTLDLAAIRAACEKATPGPWWLELVRDHYRADSRYLRAGKLHLASFDMEESKNKQADGDFCAQARTWVPALVARVEALEAALRDIQAGYYHVEVEEIARRALEGGEGA